MTNREIWKEIKKFVDDVNNGLMDYYNLDIDRKQDFASYAVGLFLESDYDDVETFCKDNAKELAEWLEEEIAYQEGAEDIEL